MVNWLISIVCIYIKYNFWEYRYFLNNVEENDIFIVNFLEKSWRNRSKINNNNHRKPRLSTFLKSANFLKEKKENDSPKKKQVNFSKKFPNSYNFSQFQGE